MGEKTELGWGKGEGEKGGPGKMSLGGWGKDAGGEGKGKDEENTGEKESFIF